MRIKIKSIEGHELRGGYPPYVVCDTGQLGYFHYLYCKEGLVNHIGKVVTANVRKRTQSVKNGHWGLKTISNIKFGDSTDIFKFRRSIGK